MMNRQSLLRRWFLGTIALILPAGVLAAAPAAPAAGGAPGSAGPRTVLDMIADRDRLLSTLGEKEIEPLLQFAFDKYAVSEEQQAIFRTFAALRRLGEDSGDMTLDAKSRMVSSIVAGIDKIVAQQKDPRKLEQLASLLVKNGTVRDVNTLEYWGENTSVQARLKPIADAIVRVYGIAADAANAEAERIAANVLGPNDLRMKEAEKYLELATSCQFSGACSSYMLALAMDKADDRRPDVINKALADLKDFEDPESGVFVQARMFAAKLNILKGDTAAARKLFAGLMSMKDEELDPNSKMDAQKRRESIAAIGWEAAYFAVVADMADNDLSAARKSIDALKTFEEANPPANAAGAKAAMQMLEWRIARLEAQKDPKANERATAILLSLVKDQPGLRGVIFDNLRDSIPRDLKDYTSLDPLLLTALVGHGEQEVRRHKEVSTMGAAEVAEHKQILQQGIDAAGEILRRKQGFAKADLDGCAFALGWFHETLDNDLAAVQAYLSYLKTGETPERREIALEQAQNALARLQKDPARRDLPDVLKIRNQFLAVATAAPYNRREFAVLYATTLLDEVDVQMRAASLPPEKKRELLAIADKAIALLKLAPPTENAMGVLYFQMLAARQRLDLSDENGKAPILSEVKTLASEIDKAFDAEALKAGGTVDPSLRLIHVRTALIASDLAWRQKGGMNQPQIAIDVLKDIEKDVAGLPHEASLLDRALYIRFNAEMGLKQETAALGTLEAYLRGKSADDGLRAVGTLMYSLDEEFKAARRQDDTARMTELAGLRAKVSGFLSKYVQESTDPKMRERAADARMFEAETAQVAASLEKDPAKRQEYIKVSMGIYQEALAQAMPKGEKDPTVRRLLAQIAMAQFDVGEYNAAQPVLWQAINERWIGFATRMVPDPTGQGTKEVDNETYWEVIYKWMRCNTELAKNPPAGKKAEDFLDAARIKLKELYITNRKVGGEAMSEDFDKLRLELLPDWKPPASATQPAA